MSLDTKSSIWADSGVPVKNRAELVPPLKVYLQLGSKLSVTNSCHLSCLLKRSDNKGWRRGVGCWHVIIVTLSCAICLLGAMKWNKNASSRIRYTRLKSGLVWLTNKKLTGWLLRMWYLISLNIAYVGSLRHFVFVFTWTLGSGCHEPKNISVCIIIY